MDVKPSLKLTPQGARKVLNAALEICEKFGRPVAVAICDDGGHLMAFERSEEAELYTIAVAINKARGAALSKFPTGRLSPTGNVRTDHHALAITLAAGTENFVSMEGGVPIKVQGQIVGAIAISGAGKKDQELAQQAADVLSK